MLTSKETSIQYQVIYKSEHGTPLDNPYVGISIAGSKFFHISEVVRYAEKLAKKVSSRNTPPG